VNQSEYTQRVHEPPELRTQVGSSDLSLLTLDGRLPAKSRRLASLVVGNERRLEDIRSTTIMVISHKFRFIFVKTQKTAGTSIETYLSQVCDSFDILTPLYP
jgi:hypothetical protein